MSSSYIADSPAIIIVIAPNPHKTHKIFKEASKKFIRIKRYTPAVTKVEEWTKEETGVGAAIAAGSQAENGICALLVEAARHKITMRGVEKQCSIKL